MSLSWYSPGQVRTERSGARQLVKALATAGVTCAGLILLYVQDPQSSRLFPPCPWHSLTALHCPGCGSLRAIHHLLHADVRGALSMNPLMIISIPMLGLLWARPSWSKKKWLPWFCLSVLVAYGILRNIGSWPFTMLSPG